MQLEAPIAGTVLAVNNSAGDTVGVSTSAASTGSNLGTTIFQIGSLSNQLVQISVNQLDAPSVKAGQPATIQFDAFPGQTFRGSVIVVTPQATTTSGVVNFPVTVAVTNPPPTLQPGMTATVNVITFQKQNVLMVPRSVVTTKAGKATVQVPDANGKLRSVDVTTGVSDATSIEITGGLHEGDAVAQMAPKQRPATAPRAATPGAGGRQPSVFIGGGPGGPPPGAP